MSAQAQFNTRAHQGYERFAMAFAAIRDPELGDVGSSLIQRIQDYGCEIEQMGRGCNSTQDRQSLSQNAQFKPSAAYIPFTYINMPPDKRLPGSPATFTNLIQIDEGSPERSMIEFAHEAAAHAENWNTIPALHASLKNGYNPEKPDIALCLDAQIEAVLETEGMAYAIQGLIGSIGAKTNPAFNAAARNDPITPEIFQAIRDESPDLETALSKAAQYALDQRHHTNSQGRVVTFGEFYTRSAIDNFASSLRLKDIQGLTFIDVKAEDFSEHGEALGMKVYRNPNFVGQNTFERYLSPDYNEKRQKLNALYGTQNRNALPTLAQACARENHTPESFLALSRAQCEPTPLL